MQLTKNFTLEELTKSSTADRLHIDNKPDETQLRKLKELCENVLQPIRDKINKPIYINSGFRCLELNKAVRGVPSSQHRLGEAADIDTRSYQGNKELFILLEEMSKNGEIEFDQLIDEYNYNWIHISYRKNSNRNQVLHIG